MTADPKSIRIQLDADVRLAAGAGGAARYVAEALGLESKAAADFQSAIVEACKEVFSYMTPAHPHLDVLLVQFEDRIEVALSREGNSAPVGGSAAGGLKPTGALEGVDRIEHEPGGAATIIRLTKYLAPHS